VKEDYLRYLLTELYNLSKNDYKYGEPILLEEIFKNSKEKQINLSSQEISKFVLEENRKKEQKMIIDLSKFSMILLMIIGIILTLEPLLPRLVYYGSLACCGLIGPITYFKIKGRAKLIAKSLKNYRN